MSALATTAAPTSMRLHLVGGDGMAPTLRAGIDYVMVRPAGRYEGEGVYVLDNGLGLDLFRVEPATRGMRLYRDNPHYTDRVLSLDDLESMIVGKVVADVIVRERRQ